MRTRVSPFCELGDLRAVRRADMNDKIDELKKEQEKLAKDRKKLANQLRNEERKRKRLRDKASCLSDADLVSVLLLRKESKELYGRRFVTTVETTPAPIGDAPPASSPTGDVMPPAIPSGEPIAADVPPAEDAPEEEL